MTRGKVHNWVLSALNLMDGEGTAVDLIRWLSGVDEKEVSHAIVDLVNDGTLTVGLKWELRRSRKGEKKTLDVKR